MFKHRDFLKAPRHFWAGIVTGLLGLLFYANFRQPQILFDLIPAYSWIKFTADPVLLPRYLSEWFPSFLHVIGMSLFTAGVMGCDRGRFWKIPLAWLVIDIIFETLQAGSGDLLLANGHFEWMDMLALAVGALVSVELLRLGRSSSQLRRTPAPGVPATGRPALAVAVGVGCFMMLGSYVSEDVDRQAREQCTYPDQSVSLCAVSPVYMSWEEIRDPQILHLSEANATPQTRELIDAGFPVLEFTGLDNPGKIYSYQDLLLVTSHLRGVYLFDNQDRENPLYLGFVSAVGAADIAVLDGYLYINAFTDLIVINLANPTETVRNTDLLSYPNVEKWLPERALFAELDEASVAEYQAIILDESLGMVVGYENSDGKVYYFWDLGL